MINYIVAIALYDHIIARITLVGTPRFWVFFFSSYVNIFLCGLCVILATYSLKFEHGDLASFLSNFTNLNETLCINETRDKNSFCSNLCPARNAPDDYPRCGPGSSVRNTLFARNEILCITLCYDKMSKIYANNAAWWEFWIKVPTREEIYLHSLKKLRYADHCLKMSYEYRKTGDLSVLSQFAADDVHNYGLQFSIFIFVLMFAANVFAFCRAI